METLAIAMVGSAGTAATATTAATAATAGLIGSAGSVTLTGLLSTGFSVFSGLASIASGNQQASAYKAMQADQEIQAKQEILSGREDALKALKALNRDLAQQTVAGYASGITGAGSAGAAKDAAIREGEYQVSIARENADMRAAQRRSQARQYGMEAKAARTSGFMDAGDAVGNLFMRNAARG